LPIAILEYEAYIGGNSPDRKSDGPSVIYGCDTPLGRSLAGLGFEGDVLIPAGEPIPTSINSLDAGSFPVYMAVDEAMLVTVLQDGLGASLEKLREDLVFFQLNGGCVEPLLRRHGLGGQQQTQATLYWDLDAVKVRDLEMPKGLDDESAEAAVTCVCGKWAGALSDRLSRGNFQCDEFFYNVWRRGMLERAVFDTAINLVGALHSFPSYADVGQYYEEELVSMTVELARAVRGILSVQLIGGVEERVVSYSRAMGKNVKTSMQPHEIAHRSLFFYNTMSKLFVMKGRPDPLEMHSEYLSFGRDKGLFTLPSDINLPKTN
jgi:hypothetical protein